MLDDCERALEPLRSMLAADGYVLHLESSFGRRDQLTVIVEAGPDACEECLVPVDLFTDIVTRRLTESGLQPSITVVYPDQSNETVLFSGNTEGMECCKGERTMNAEPVIRSGSSDRAGGAGRGSDQRAPREPFQPDGCFRLGLPVQGPDPLRRHSRAHRRAVFRCTLR